MSHDNIDQSHYRTDAVTLLGTFKTLGAIIKASPEDLALCPGLGPNKAKKLHKVFSEQFRRNVEPSNSQQSKSVIQTTDKDHFSDEDDQELENI